MESEEFLVAYDATQNPMLWSVRLQDGRFACRIWRLTEADLHRIDSGIIVVAALNDAAPSIGIFADAAAALAFFAGKGGAAATRYAETLLKRFGIEQTHIFKAD